MNSKIKKINELKSLVLELQSSGKKIVHCHGVFDLIHIGHIKHFQEAKSYGDILIVTLTPDKYVNKGPNRPAFPALLRLESLVALEMIDYVAINEWPTAIECINIINPNIFCKGPDYRNSSDDITGNIEKEVNAVKQNGGEIKYTNDITFSSSNILNTYTEVYTDDQKKFIKQIMETLSFEDIKEKLNKLNNLRVMVLGETIIDQYVFCEALGKSGKEPVLVLRELDMDQYAGGAAAIARHLSEFCNNISLLSMLGEKKEFRDFVMHNFQDNTNATFIYKDNAPTIVKKRYVDSISKNKTLGVYSINDSKLNKNNLNELRDYLNAMMPKHDIIIISDYGHGFISKEIADNISKDSLFTSLNAQINAANIGYHTMNNYKNINCAIINETELRHELRDRDGDIKLLMERLIKTLKAKILIVTRGKEGSLLYNKEKNKMFHCPAFASNVVDKIGAGDAMLALTSCALKLGFNDEFSLFIGSLAAAQSVESIGNSQAVSKTLLLKTIKHAMK